MKKLLVNGVEETLLLGVVCHHLGGAFYGEIKAVKPLQKRLTVEGVGGERINDGLNFAGDDISADEVGILKDSSEQPDGQEVLDKHLLNCIFGEVWVECLTAFLVEVVKGGGKLWVCLPCFCDDFFQSLSDSWHSVFELCDGFFPFIVSLRPVVKEDLEYINELGRVGEVGIEYLLTVSETGWRVLGFGR